ncbi:MAG TPA: superoxide dismutase family protein [Vicinamibacterales bacterium]|jgi:Cu-Zn family superoxide dismutase|nr:superoxide dismutase family protein [Vicinamibacterales bacterium]
MRHMAGAVLFAAIAVVSAGAAGEQARATLKNAQGETVGEATLTETPHGVLIHVDLTKAPAGAHAFHLHAVGKCEPPFTTAGGHFNPSSKQHGLENPMGMHAGDMPNIDVPSDGRLAFDVLNHDVTLAAGANSLLDADGSAIVIHAKGDDYKSDPAGNAGDRVICGIVSK